MFVAVIWANLVLTVAGLPTSSLSRSVLDLASAIKSPSGSTNRGRTGPAAPVACSIRQRGHGGPEAALVSQPLMRMHNDLSPNPPAQCVEPDSRSSRYTIKEGFP
ncbi:hypothetical protein EDB84DRAFT_1552300 [Lactarius hengduanensis]|nr:hypothetical protein EDB84DRAFT_1552300 [Lactarius hengduanensis]